jgi:hypothetical protein
LQQDRGLVGCGGFCYQGDQIWRIFARWVIVYSGYFSLNYRSSQNVRAIFFHGKGYALILSKNAFGQHFGRFFHKLIWSPCLLQSFIRYSLCISQSKKIGSSQIFNSAEKTGRQQGCQMVYCTNQKSQFW